MSKLLEKINALKAHRDTVLAPLEAKSDSWTPEDRKAYGEAIEKAEALKSDVELMQKASGVADFLNSGQAGQVVKDAAGMNFEGQVGTTTIDANKGVVNEDGVSLTSKTLQLTAEPTYKRAFNNFLRKHGNVDAADLKTLMDVSAKAMQEGLDSSGGVLVPVDMLSEILRREAGATSLVSQVRTIPTSRDKLSLPRFEYDTDDTYTSALDFQWAGENGPTAEDTSLEDWGTKDIPVYTGSFQVEMTRDLLEDSYVNVEAWANEMIQEAYNLRVENLIVNGTGINRPTGFLIGVGNAKRAPSTNLGNPITADNIMAMHYALPSQYRGQAAYVARGTVIGTIAQLKEGTGQTYAGLVGNMDNRGLASERQEAILGKPLLQSEMMPASGAGNNVLALANWRKAYALVMRVGMTIEPYGQTDREMLRLNRRGYHVRVRLGGDVLQDRAIRIGVQS